MAKDSSKRKGAASGKAKPAAKRHEPKVPPPGTQGGRPARGDTHMTPEKWAQARRMWEEDAKISATYVADWFLVTVRSVRERITRERWTRDIHKQLVHVPRTPADTVEAQVQPKRGPGAPSKYLPEYADRLVEFFRETPFETSDVVEHDGRKRSKLISAYRFPTLQRFADDIGVAFETLHDWATAKGPDGEPRYPEFSYAYKRAKTIQSAILVEGGMAGLFQPAMAIFGAKNLLGWTDKVETADPEATGDRYPEQAELDSAYERALKLRQEQREMIAARKASLS